jgi:hypothetical protein
MLLQYRIKTGLLDQGTPMRNSNGENTEQQTMCPGLWRLGRTCVDYIVFTRPLQAVSAERWLVQVSCMRVLGICDDTPFGVVTVRGTWGFFQIPAAGFPELKITFFQSGKEADRMHLLITLANILEIE